MSRSAVLRRVIVGVAIAGALAALAWTLQDGEDRAMGESASRASRPNASPPNTRTVPREGPSLEARPADDAAADPSHRDLKIQVVQDIGDLETRPIANATVFLGASDGSERSARSGSDGIARFEDPPTGDLTCRGEAAGFVGSESQGVILGEINLVLLEPAVVREGIVLDARTRQGVPGARVRALAGLVLAHNMDAYFLAALEEEALQLGQTTTDAAGRFRIDTLPPRSQSLLVADHAGRWGRLAVEAPDLGKERPPVVIFLAPASRLRGRVTTPDGRPVARALVAAAPDTAPDAVAGVLDGSVLQDARFGNGVTRIVRADAQGIWTIEGVGLGVWALVAKGEGAPSEAVTDVVLTEATPERSVDLRVRAWGQVVVHVRTPDGEILTDARVNVEGWRGSGSGGPPGTWTYPSVVPGRRAVSARAPGWDRGSTAVEVRSGESVEVTVTLTPGLTVAGVVLDEESRPCPGVLVNAFWVGEDEEFSLVAKDTADAEGRFRLTGLSRAPYRFEAETEDRIALAAQDLQADVSALRLVLKKGVALRVLVLDGDGAPVHGASVDARGPVYRIGNTGIEGEGASIRLPPGAYRVGFTWGAEDDPHPQVEVRAGEPATVVLRTE